MSSNTEFLQNWNEIIQFKIKETDLDHPSELFLTNALLHYLQKLNFDISFLINVKDTEIPENRRKFKFELCAYIDYLYKSGNEASNSFFYYDLICPSPKKTVHLLNFLLNYLFFYNVMKEEVIQPTEIKIRERSEILDKKSNLLVENEKHQYQAKNIAKTLEEHKITLPKLTQKLNKLEINEREQNDMKKRLEASFETNKTRLIDIKKDENTILSEIVSEEEIEKLKTKKLNLQKSIDTQIEIEQSIIINHRERTTRINELEPLISKLEKSMDIINLEDIKKLKELNRSYRELSEKVSGVKINNDKTSALIKKDLETSEKLDIFLNKKTEELNKLEQLYQEEVVKLEKNCEVEHLKHGNLDSQFNKLCYDITEQQEFANIINSSAEKLFHQLISGDPNMLKPNYE